MKTNSTHALILRIILFILLCLYSFLVFGQPDYDFRNKTLLSGSDRQVGAVYRFNNVKTGVDAKLTILALTNGLTLSEIDRDAGSGFIAALQPDITIPAGSNGYVEFRIDFLITGTNIPFVQLEIPVTPIDVDGQTHAGGFVYEYDMIRLVSGYYTFDGMGNELQVTPSPEWVTGINTAAYTYPGVDTLARQVMFTVVNGNQSSILMRVGGTNSGTSSTTRLRSVYFKRFVYQNAVLPVTSLLKFSGHASDDNTKLQWSLTAGNNASSIVLEKGYTANNFQPHAEFWVNMEGSNKSDFQFTDTKNDEGSVYYRLKITEADGRTEYSNILHFTGNKTTINSFMVYPSQVTSSVTIKLKSDLKKQGSFEVFDYSGRVVFRQPIELQKGENNIRISDLEKLPSGNYITTIRTTEKLYSQKINKL